MVDLQRENHRDDFVARDAIAHSDRVEQFDSHTPIRRNLSVAGEVDGEGVKTSVMLGVLGYVNGLKGDGEPLPETAGISGFCTNLPESGVSVVRDNEMKNIPILCQMKVQRLVHQFPDTEVVAKCETCLAVLGKWSVSGYISGMTREVELGNIGVRLPQCRECPYI